jgi:hypothetical protein
MFVRPFAIGPPLAIINDSFRGGKLSHTSQQITQVPYFKVSVPQVSRVRAPLRTLLQLYFFSQNQNCNILKM